MGQKVHPGGLRVGVIHDWKSNWWTGKKEIADYLLEDIKIRDHINGKLAHAGLSDILIRKDKQRVTVDIYTARPGIVIGKSGVEVDALRKDLHAITGKSVHININEIKRPELDAQLVAQSIAEQLQNRVAFRRAMKRSLASAMRSGAQGIKIQCGGRLGGGEMSRSERYTEGRVPLHTIRADIDYGFAEAKTTYGRIGVKVWVNKGEIMPEGYEGSLGRERITEADGSRRRRGSNSEGLGASREGGRGRGQDREGLGLVQKRRRPGGRGRGGQARGPARDRAAAPETQAPPVDEATADRDPDRVRRRPRPRRRRRGRGSISNSWRASTRDPRRIASSSVAHGLSSPTLPASRCLRQDARDVEPSRGATPMLMPRKTKTGAARATRRARPTCSTAITGSRRSRTAG